MNPQEGHRDDQRAGVPLLYTKAERDVAVQPEEGSGDILDHISEYNVGALESGEGLLTSVCSDRIWRNVFKLKEGR